ncbi:MAG TPA: ATPase, partial [Bacteroidia bacterium]|nr:ATPase [Bacteroidia bacterium]
MNMAGGGTANRELSFTRLVDAPCELVFEVWTNPEHLIHWWG